MRTSEEIQKEIAKLQDELDQTLEHENKFEVLDKIYLVKEHRTNQVSCDWEPCVTFAITGKDNHKYVLASIFRDNIEVFGLLPENLGFVLNGPERSLEVTHE